MRDSVCCQKASIIDAFFYDRTCLALPLFCLLVFGLYFPAQATATTCGSDHYDETVQVSKVYDGDTLRLKDGRNVRIIGINTPELARDKSPAEPWSSQAKSALQQLLSQDRRVKLRWGQEKRDRYGRLLSHVFLPNGDNVSERLLSSGYALALTVPPNTWGWTCYARAEAIARSRKQRLWSDKYYQAIPTHRLSPSSRGFRLVDGQVQRVGFGKSAIWLNLESNFALRIKRNDLNYFNGVDFKELTGKRITARGWINRHNNQLRMRVKHPAALEIKTP